MKYQIKKEKVPFKENFLFITENEKKREKKKLNYPVRALLWNEEIYPVEFLNSLIEYETIDFIICIPENLNDLTLFLISVFEIQEWKDENDIIILLDMISRFNIPEYIYKDILSDSIGQKFLKHYDFYKWTTSLDFETKNFLINKSISLKTFYNLKDKDKSIINKFIEIIKTISPNNNFFKNIIDWINEISIRDNISFSDILLKLEFEELKKSYIPEKEKNTIFKNRLYNLRYPMWTKKREKIKSISKSIFSKTGIEVITPEFNEGNYIEIKFKIKNEQEIEEKKIQIENEKEKFKEILREIKI